eukprot:scaffold3643_cov267-Pinguiococcus_pyrenoidosus.AAC.5
MLLAEALIPASAANRIPDGEVRRRRREVRRLAHRFRAVNGKRIGGIVQEVHPEILGNVVRRRDLVESGPSREELARPHPLVILVPPDGFLRREPPKALHEAPFDLADVNHGVDGLSEVHEDVAAKNREIARQAVHFHLGARDALREVVEGHATAGVVISHRCVPVVAAPISRDGVEALSAEVDPFEVGLLDDGRPGRVATGILLDDRAQVAQNLLACIQNSHTVEIRGHRRRRGRRIGDLVRGGLSHVDHRRRNAEALRSDGCHLRVQALPHLRTSMAHQDGSIRVDMDQRTSLVHKLGSKVDAKLGRDPRDAALSVPIVPIEMIDQRLSRRKVAAAEQLVQHARDMPRGPWDPLPVVRDRTVSVEVPLSHLHHVHLQGCREVVHGGFADHHSLRPSEAAERGMRRHVCPAHVPRGAEGAPLVGVVQMEEGAVHHRRREVQAAAGVVVDVHLEEAQISLRIGAGSILGIEGMPLTRALHVDVAIQHDPNGHLEMAGRDGNCTGDEHAPRFLATKRSSHALHARDHFVRVHPTDVRREILSLRAVLRGAKDLQAAIFLGDHQRCVGLQVEVLLASNEALAIDDRTAVGLQQGCLLGICIAVLDLVDVRHVGFRRNCVLNVEDGLQIFVFHVHLGSRDARKVCRRRDDNTDDLPDAVHELRGEALLVFDNGTDRVVPWHVIGSEESLHAFHLQRRRRVNAEDARMGPLGQHKASMQSVRRSGNVVHVAGLSGHLLQRRLVHERLAHRRPLGIGARRLGRVRLWPRALQAASLDLVVMLPTRNALRLVNEGPLTRLEHRFELQHSRGQRIVRGPLIQQIAAAQEELEQERRRQGDAVLRLPARHRVWKTKLFGQDLGGFSHQLRRPRFPDEEVLGLDRSFGDSCHASEAQPRPGDLPFAFLGRVANANATGDNADVVLSSPRLLEGHEDLVALRKRDADMDNDLVRPQGSLSVGHEEVAHRQLPDATAQAMENQRRVGRHEHGVHVADGGGRGQIPRQRSDVANLVGCKPAQHLLHRMRSLRRVLAVLRVGCEEVLDIAEGGTASDCQMIFTGTKLGELGDIPDVDVDPRPSALELEIDAHFRVAADDDGVWELVLEHEELLETHGLEPLHISMIPRKGRRRAEHERWREDRLADAKLAVVLAEDRFRPALLRGHVNFLVGRNGGESIGHARIVRVLTIGLVQSSTASPSSAATSTATAFVVGGEGLGCIQDGSIARAPAQVAVHAFLDFGSGDVRVLSQKRVERHHEARRAEAALRAVRPRQALLHRMQPLLHGPCGRLHGRKREPVSQNASTLS